MSFFPPTPFTKTTFPNNGYNGFVNFDFEGIPENAPWQTSHSNETKQIVEQHLRLGRETGRFDITNRINLSIDPIFEQNMAYAHRIMHSNTRISHQDVSLDDFNRLRKCSTHLWTIRNNPVKVFVDEASRSITLSSSGEHIQSRYYFEAMVLEKTTEYRTTAFQETWNWYMRSTI